MSHDAVPRSIPLQQRRSRSSWLLFTLLALLVGATTIRRIHDPDIWWHLRTGEWIWQHRAIPHIDPFSHTAPGPWRYTEILAQLGLHGLYAGLGLGAVIVGMAFVGAGFILATAWLILDVTSVGTAAAALALAIVAMAADLRMGPKTDVFSFLALALLLRLLLGSSRRRTARALLWVPALMLIWGNLHRGGTLGILVLGVGSGVWFLRREAPLGGLRLVGLLVASSLALLCNSGGWWYLWSSLRMLGSAGYARWLPEWSPATLTFLTRVDPAFTLGLLLWAFGWTRRKRGDAEAAVAALCIALALLSIRMVPLAMVAMAPGMARGIQAALELGRHVPLDGPRGDGLGGALAALLIVSKFVLSVPASHWGTSILPWRVPVAAANFLRQHPPPGPMWNSFDFGGYLVFALPQQKVFIDGRNDTVYPLKFFEQTALATVHPPTLLRQLERYRIGYAVIKCTALEDKHFTWLAENPAWQLVYLDDLVAIVVHRSPESEGYLEQHAYRELRPDNALSRAAALSADPHPERLMQEIARNLAQSPDSLRAAVLQALVFRAMGAKAEYDAARTAIDTLAAERGIPLQLPATQY